MKGGLILEVLAVLIALYAPTVELVAESKLVVPLNGRTLYVNTCQDYGVLRYNRCQITGRPYGRP